MVQETRKTTINI